MFDNLLIYVVFKRLIILQLQQYFSYFLLLHQNQTVFVLFISASYNARFLISPFSFSLQPKMHSRRLNLPTPAAAAAVPNTAAAAAAAALRLSVRKGDRHYLRLQCTFCRH